jgi:hypothetical protein
MVRHPVQSTHKVPARKRASLFSLALALKIKVNSVIPATKILMQVSAMTLTSLAATTAGHSQASDRAPSKTDANSRTVGIDVLFLAMDVCYLKFSLSCGRAKELKSANIYGRLHRQECLDHRG